MVRSTQERGVLTTYLLLLLLLLRIVPRRIVWIGRARLLLRVSIAVGGVPFCPLLTVILLLLLLLTLDLLRVLGPDFGIGARRRARIVLGQTLLHRSVKRPTSPCKLFVHRSELAQLDAVPVDEFHDLRSQRQRGLI